MEWNLGYFGRGEKEEKGGGFMHTSWTGGPLTTLQKQTGVLIIPNLSKMDGYCDLDRQCTVKIGDKDV